MKIGKKFLLIAAAAAALTVNAAKPIGLRSIVDGDFNPEKYTDVTPMKDGESFAVLSKDGKQIVKYSFKTGEKTAILFDVNATRGEKIQQIDDYTLSPDESRILVRTNTQRIYRRSRKAEFFIYTPSGNSLAKLSVNGPQQEPLFSQDGNQIAFVRDGNLFLVKLLFNNSESQITKDGKFNEIINGLPDWVNEEEFSWARAFDFSADGTMLAWVRYDESRVPLFEMPLYKGSNPSLAENAQYPGKYSYKYPVAGAQNSKVSVMTYDIKSHVTRTMKVPLDSDGYIPRIKFSSTPDQLAIVTLNRHQSRMELYMGNARSNICKLLLREEDDKYVKEDAYLQLKFFGNNFALVSDRDGKRQLYWYSTTGQLVKQITAGQNEVTKFYGFNPEQQAFYYEATDGSPLRTAVYCTTLKGKTAKLSAQQGWNSATFSSSYKFFINEYSNQKTPPVVTLCNAEGKTQKVLIGNDALKQKLQSVDLAQKELFSFKTSEGVELNGWMMKPADFNAGKKYPVILYQYSGPGSQQVKDAWGDGFMPGGLFESYLAGKGFIVVCVDGRGTGQRGADFEKCTYLNLGRLEARDQVETALYLGQQAYVDKDNIGIWGWSYGGFATLMSMSEGRPVFKAGVAVAPPTDCRFYDTVYTERYMRTPQENNDGYDYNALTRAKNLHGSLLICHGLADDNVHFQNTAEYAEALVQADKQFDMQVYTNRNHSIYGGETRYHLLTRISDFFQKELK